jgi:methylenetetrahydrofolate dehydrogenase (NADP+)/methenyltetrahydrofolate cyclohydrolase
MILLDGNALSATLKNEMAQTVARMVSDGRRPPHLVAVLVGENPASAAYVRNKIRSCEAVGFRSTLLQHPADVTEAELLQVVEELNHSPEVDGFIVQLPLPRHISEERITLAIRPEKDVDGFHPLNFGRMAQGMPAFIPATPYGILLLLERYGIQTDGRHCVVVGRSNIVGLPMSILMARKGYPGNCTVTLVHSRTVDLPAETRRADILIAAIGVPEFIKGDMVKEGAVVVDVGINSVPDPGRKSGFRLVGDVAFDEVASKASAITPVPGGVGPMTVAALLLNTLKSTGY